MKELSGLARNKRRRVSHDLRARSKERWLTAAAGLVALTLDFMESYRVPPRSQLRRQLALRLIRAGLGVSHVARAVNAKRATVYRWIKDARGQSAS
jgi:transposase-like protein